MVCQWNALFFHIAHDYSRADWDGLCDYFRDVPWEDIFKLSVSAAANEFCEWLQVGSDVYIPYCKYQVKPHSSPWFLAAFVAAIVHRNHFFCFYQWNKSSECKLKFRQVSNCYKSVLETAIRAYVNETKESTTPQKHGSLDFWWIANSVLNRRKSAVHPVFNSLEVLFSGSDKAKWFAKNFLKKSNFDDFDYPFLLLKLHNISVTPKIVKKVTTNLDSLKASCPDCIPVVFLKNCEPELSYLITELFSKCLKECCFPHCWKISLVVPVFKNVGERSTAKKTALLFFFLWLVNSLKKL